MSQKKRVRIYKAGGQQGAYINSTAQWMMQMGGAPQEMMDPQMQEIQPIQEPGMMNPNMQQPQEIDPQELMQIVMEQREQGAEFEEIVNMLMDTVPGLDDQLLMQVVDEVQMMEQEQGLGEEPPIEEQELDEEELLRKGGTNKNLRKKFVKEYVKGGIAQNAKASEVAGDAAFNLLDFVGRTNKESLLKTKGEELANSMFPEQSMPAMYRGGLRKAKVGDAGKDANEAAEETFTRAQMEAYVKEQIENNQKSYQEQFQRQFQGYPGGYGYPSGYNMPGGHGYPYGPGVRSPRNGYFDPGDEGYARFYNAGPGMGYSGVRYPQLGNLMNMFSKDPDRKTYSSNLSAEELKNVLGDDFQGYEREVLDYDKRFLRKPFEKHVRYTINRGTGKPEPVTTTSAEANKDEKYWEDNYRDPSTGEIISHSSSGNEDIRDTNKRFNPFNRADRIIRRDQRRDQRRGNINSDYISPPDSTSSSRVIEPGSRQELTPDEGKGTWEGRQQFMEGLVRSQLQLPKTSNNKKESSTDLPEGFLIDTRGPREMAYGGVPKYWPGGPVEDILQKEGQEREKRFNSQLFPKSRYGFPHPMRNPRIFGFPNYQPLGLEGAEELLGKAFGEPWEKKYSLLNQQTEEGQNQKDAVIDEKTEEGQSYIDPSAIYNFGVQAFFNKDMYDKDMQNKSRFFGDTTNQLIDTTINNNPYAFNTGQLSNEETLTDQTDKQAMAKRGGSMGKYKAGGTYMLEQDVINKIKAAGGIIKFLD